MGYNLGTNDPFAVERRRREDAVRASREALAPTGTESFQAVRKLQQQLADLTHFVASMPQNKGDQVDTSGFTVTNPSGWVTVAESTITRPANMGRVVVHATANAVTVARPDQFGNMNDVRARLVINGAVSSTANGSIVVNASTYSSHVSVAFVHGFQVTGSVVVELQLQGSGFDVFASSNKAALSVLAGFSVV